MAAPKRITRHCAACASVHADAGWAVTVTWGGGREGVGGGGSSNRRALLGLSRPRRPGVVGGLVDSLETPKPAQRAQVSKPEGVHALTRNTTRHSPPPPARTVPLPASDADSYTTTPAPRPHPPPWVPYHSGESSQSPGSGTPAVGQGRWRERAVRGGRRGAAGAGGAGRVGGDRWAGRCVALPGAAAMADGGAGQVLLRARGAAGGPAAGPRGLGASAQPASTPPSPPTPPTPPTSSTPPTLHPLTLSSLGWRLVSQARRKFEKKRPGGEPRKNRRQQTRPQDGLRGRQGRPRHPTPTYTIFRPPPCGWPPPPGPAPGPPPRGRPTQGASAAPSACARQERT